MTQFYTDKDGKVRPISEPWMTGNPFSSEEINSYNSMRTSESDLNREFRETVALKESKIKNKLNEYGIREMPPEVRDALDFYRKKLYEFLDASRRATLIAPSPMAVGPANYRGNAEMARKMENRGLDNLEHAQERLDRAVADSVRGVGRLEDRTGIGMEELTGPKLKKVLGAKSIGKSYHNKHKDGTGNAGYVIVDKNGKWYQLNVTYDSRGEIYDASFGPYGSAPGRLSAKSYDELVRQIKERMT
ncbi:MAG: hypothetical protein JRN26_04685 [Nitrososphaerota archaeon]|jgi:hypothetical protein|nr:hypothetical protein [Nitrososphaerota archaeon]MDG6927845.1 hypothetical protein [Nitrososphaerota archaeon]MDG6931273.1 hypothetical protein [Nitrososphaerota archaeon]MDG6932140.1 hypothetical protein [Nitrososphaerota archaeon]MDG6936161.1 hypothetical protein [Nitrososphaerota archaeon]